MQHPKHVGKMSFVIETELSRISHASGAIDYASNQLQLQIKRFALEVAHVGLKNNFAKPQSHIVLCLPPVALQLFCKKFCDQLRDARAAVWKKFKEAPFAPSVLTNACGTGLLFLRRARAHQLVLPALCFRSRRATLQCELALCCRKNVARQRAACLPATLLFRAHVPQ
jgi:hypothetical protein